jgi:hypothetical protein
MMQRDCGGSPHRYESSKKPYGDIVPLVLRKRVSLGPPFFFEVGNDVLAGGFGRGFPKQGSHFPYACFVVAETAVAHTMRGPSGKFVKPPVDLFERPAKPKFSLPAMLVKG